MTVSISVLVANFTPLHCAGNLTSCKSNLKNIATALEMYSTDNGGLYPHSLHQLTPKYLKTIPNCPNAELDTYSPGYRHQALPDLFTLDCHGLNHKTEGISAPNYPRYGNVEGLTER